MLSVYIICMTICHRIIFAENLLVLDLAAGFNLIGIIILSPIILHEIIKRVLHVR